MRQVLDIKEKEDIKEQMLINIAIEFGDINLKELNIIDKNKNTQ